MTRDPFKRPTSDTWRAIQSLAGEMLADPMEAVRQQPVEPVPLSESTLNRFRQALALPSHIAQPAPATDLVTRWCSPEVQQDWFTLLRQGLASLRASGQAAVSGHTLEPLQNVIAQIAGEMRPAPAMRGYTTSRLHFPRRSRRVHAADLPSFTPLFCTALRDDRNQTSVSGLQAEQNYRIRFRAAAHPEWRHEDHLVSQPDGSLVLPFDEAFHLLPDSGEANDLVWFLEEDPTDRFSGEGWVSGLVWKPPVVRKELVHELTGALSDSDDAMTEERVHTLLAINLLIAEQRYLDAYETTRQSLLFAPGSDDEDSAPFTEALWQMIDLILQQMTARLKHAETAFRMIHPEWNAADSLDRLIDEVKLISA